MFWQYMQVIVNSSIADLKQIVKYSVHSLAFNPFSVFLHASAPGTNRTNADRNLPMHIQAKWGKKLCLGESRVVSSDLMWKGCKLS